MADKKVPLTIVLRVLDGATGAIDKAGKRLKEITKPAREFGRALGEFGEASGLNTVGERLRGVRDATGTALARVALLGAAVGAAVLGLKSLVDEFDEVGDKAERLGVGVDFLSAMRFAAEMTGAEIEGLDDGIKTFVVGLGQARANTGKLHSFLGKVDPGGAILRQLKSAKSIEQAYDIAANAASKLTDPAKRATFAAKVFGNAELAPLLGRGAKGAKELREEFLQLAGSQEEAAAAAGKADDALKRLDAASKGVKAAIAAGLSPVIEQLAGELGAFFSENRERIGEWALEMGRTLPDKIHIASDAVLDFLDDASRFLDEIGGMKTAAIALGVVIAGPLVAAVVSLGVALLTTPVGWFLGSIALMTLGAKELMGGWEPLGAFFIGLWDGVKKTFEDAWVVIGPIVEAIRTAAKFMDSIGIGFGTFARVVNPLTNGRGGSTNDVAANVRAAQAALQQPAPGSTAKLLVDFINMPRGVTAKVDPSATNTDVDVTRGWVLGMLE